MRKRSRTTDPPAQKDSAAAELGRRGGLKGGKARAAAMTAVERRASAKRAAAARWGTAVRAPEPARQLGLDGGELALEPQPPAAAGNPFDDDLNADGTCWWFDDQDRCQRPATKAGFVPRGDSPGSLELRYCDVHWGYDKIVTLFYRSMSQVGATARAWATGQADEVEMRRIATKHAELARLHDRVVALCFPKTAVELRARR